MTVHAHRLRMGQVEAAVDDERALRRLKREVVADAELDDEEREFTVRRIDFYLSDMHRRLRAARDGEPDLLEPES